MIRYILGLICALGVGNYFGQTVQVHFEGTVYDEDNSIIKGAKVEVYKDAAVFNLIKSDENGNYNVYLPLNGDYDITISKSGYVQKKYFVSTKNIPDNKSQIQFATNVADIVLNPRYEGVDYSLFDKPMNKYYYDVKKDNIAFDEDYLKEMKAAVKEFLKKNEERLKLEAEKNKLAKKQAQEKAKADKVLMEKENAEKLALEKKQAEEREAIDKAFANKSTKDKNAEKGKTKEAIVNKIKPQPNVVGNVSVEQKPDKTIISTSTSIKKDIKDPRILSLLAKYKPGITEEIFEGNGVYVIQRVLVRDDMVWIYQKKIFSWGGISCFRDKQPITEGTFDAETKKS